MKNKLIFLLLVIAGTAITILQASAYADENPDVDKAIDVIMKFCGGKSNVDKLIVDGDASGGLSLNIFTRKLGGDASLASKVNLEKSNIEGVVNGLNGAINKLSSQQATEFRACAKPYIDRLLDVLLPRQVGKNQTEGIEPESLVGWWEYKYDGTFNADPILFYLDDSGRLMMKSGDQEIGEPNQFSNVELNENRLRYKRRLQIGTSKADLTIINDGHMIGSSEDSRGVVTLELKRYFPGYSPHLNPKVIALPKSR